MIELHVFNGNIKIVKPETITSGRVGHKVYISFDNKWENLIYKKATFKAGNLLKVIEIADNVNEAIIEIPVEVLAYPNYDLEIGIKGYDSEFNTILPTKYQRLGRIHQGSQILSEESAHMIEDYQEGKEELHIATNQEIEEMLDDIFN